VINIDAETIGDSRASDGPPIACFSGGIDSAYSLYQLAKNGLEQTGLQPAALMVHGFDIPLQDGEGFKQAVIRSRRMVDSLHVPLILMQSNIRSAFRSWSTSFGCCVAAALTVLSGKFVRGLIAGHGRHLSQIPWGSTPLTDPLLGSSDFPIIHDGAATRLDKVRALCDWPAALENLRFCWQLKPASGNCGQCTKCILTAIEFRCAGVEPACFAAPVSDQAIIDALERYEPSPVSDIFFQEALDACLAAGMTEPWIPSLQRLVDTFSPRH
jgi:hypothetical protein